MLEGGSSWIWKLPHILEKDTEGGWGSFVYMLVKQKPSAKLTSGFPLRFQLLTLDQHLGKGLSGAHPIGDLAAVAAGICRACGLQAQQLVPGNSSFREDATHTAPLEGEWGGAMSQALQLKQLPWLH